MNINNLNNNINFTARLIVNQKRSEFDYNFYDNLSDIAKGIGNDEDIIVMDDTHGRGSNGLSSKFYRHVDFNYYSKSLFPTKQTAVVEEIADGLYKKASDFVGRSECLTLHDFKNKIITALNELKEKI